MTLPNILTISRIAFIPLIILLLYLKQNVFAAVVFLILSLFDAFDGYLARRLNKVSDFGKLMDPIADKLLVLSTLIMLVQVRMVSALPVIILAAREIAISFWRSQKASHGKVIPASHMGKIKTALQVVAVLMLILALPLGELVLWISVFVSLISGAEYIWKK